MDELRRAVRTDGFSRLDRRLDRSVATADPGATLAAIAGAYVDFAVEHLHLYRAMVVERPPGPEHRNEPDPGELTFRRLELRVLSGIEQGRFRVGTPATAQLWAALHGLANLALAETVAPGQVRAVLADLLVRLSIGYGDEPEFGQASVDASLGL
ncbi:MULTISPECIES: TetR-like C-terminal domain-containing protein [unclassified Pseudonocardia]|uniref:TetR-like C-terminal domain-containing protein n=1 Tax=unclassified Pseudonocardia TaxID=2619320 RepID=UPI0009E6DA4B|nr:MULTISPECIES: TetR-like C-terminal domain-containing protein [unclassified Pseudonocardia]